MTGAMEESLGLNSGVSLERWFYNQGSVFKIPSLFSNAGLVSLTLNVFIYYYGCKNLIFNL